MNARLNDLNFHDPVSAYSRMEQQERVRRLQRELLQAAGESVLGKQLWFVLSVRKRSEKRIFDSLTKEKIHSWMPEKKRCSARYKRRGSAVSADLIFPGYLFVRIVPSAHAFAGLRLVKGVESILGHGEGPTPVSDEIMNELMGMVSVGLFDDKRVYASDRTYRKGDRVTISHGAFQFVQAVVEGYHKTKHVRCIANLFGGQVPVNVPLDKIDLL